MTSASSSATRRTYRKDIDGLRAVAVLLVVFNHLQFRSFDGGYVGVDVFFVISGYLIGASLITEFSEGRFSLAAFYERRIRRILPALLAMLIMVSVLTYHFFSATSLASYASSLSAAVLSYSNFFFWRQAGYFDAPSGAKPLLHTWSLAVEEQFYIFFPLLLYAVFRWFPQRLKAALWTAAVVSFVVAVWFTRVDSSTAFFWSPLRAWELLAGVLVSQYGYNVLSRRINREMAAFWGLVFILFSGFHYTAQTLFPGWTAMVPCVGAAMLLASGQTGKSLTGSILSTPVLRFVGLISYSLYLWHWPILVLQRTCLLFTDRSVNERMTKVMLLGISLVIATLSWRLIEVPFRAGRLKPSRAWLFAITSTTACVILITSLFWVESRGFPSRFSANILHIQSFEDYDTSVAWRSGSCFLLPTNKIADFDAATCIGKPKARQTRYLLLGDSLAAQLYPGMKLNFPEANIQQATAAACPFPFDLEMVTSPYRENCIALNNYVRTVIFPSHKTDVVLLASGWDDWAPARLGAEIEAIRKQGMDVVLFGPSLEYDIALPELILREMRVGDSPAARNQVLSEHLLPKGVALDQEMSRLARDQWHVRYISYFATLCSHRYGSEANQHWQTNSGCPAFTSTGDVVTFDIHHITVPASIEFLRAVHAQGQLP